MEERDSPTMWQDPREVRRDEAQPQLDVSLSASGGVPTAVGRAPVWVSLRQSVASCAG